MSLDRIVAALGLGLAAALGAAVVAGAVDHDQEPLVVPIEIHYSHFAPAALRVPAGRPITFVITNTDPIDHEWIVGDEALHERHRTGTEPVHNARPTEVSIDAGREIRTTVTFTSPGTLTYICHLPGHEAYGMVGSLVVTGG
ncbi:MAG TPA: plastocyanin/azurin family copper-binding protein [Candidatus Limnocylindrales bacterium]|nr:plastocyanin/azurin family copper-binding protein [Candidatus Limnocylindrales bacterium]